MSVATSAAAANNGVSPAYSATAFQALRKQSSQSLRMRPPDVDSFVLDENSRIPLRTGSGRTLRSEQSRESNRDSRIGFRGFFARRPAGQESSRASTADLSGWQYPLQGPRSAAVFPASKNASPAPSVLGEQPDLLQLPLQTPGPHASQEELPQPSQIHALQPGTISLSPGTSDPDHSPRNPTAASRSRTQAPSVRPARPSLATWDPPPLFQAYPQAIKHVQLLTCTASIDALLRVQSSRDGIDARESPTSDSASTEDLGLAGERPDKPKRRHRSNTSASSMKLDWSGKIYVFVTSGYLLQYSAEGSFDRLPEKILPISRDSAAFVSDLIPGRHWVLRVCSALERGGSQSGDSRSLLSRLPFRGSDRRHASTLLMAFDSAEDMESWITTLRREIEHLGGKKHLSETGRPKPDYAVPQQKPQPTHRTLVTRDPERFSRITSPQDIHPFSSRRRESYIGSAREGHHELQWANTRSTQDREAPSRDDVSTTNSVRSQDSRHLENLRDSNNRYSYISSGQRTMFTSDTGLSPPCSPSRDSFSSKRNDEQATPSGTESPREVRPRPNASAIHERRKSLQAAAFHQRAAELHAMSLKAVSTLDMPPQRPPILSFMTSVSKPPTQPLPAPPLREAYSGYFDSRGPSRSTAHTASTPSPPVPNFSVPHSSHRFSGILKTSSSDPVLSPGLPLQYPDAEPTSQQRQQQHQQQYQQQQHRQQQYQLLPREQLPATSPPPRSPPQEKKEHSYSPFPTGANTSMRKLPPPSIDYPRRLSVATDQLPAAPSPSIFRTKPRSSTNDSNLSTASHNSEVCNTPRVPGENAGRPSTSSQRSGSSNVSAMKSRGSIKDKLSRSPSSKESSPQKPPRKRGAMQSLRSSLAAKLQSVVHADSLAFAVPYSAALPVPISQAAGQYKNRALPKSTLSVPEEVESEVPVDAKQIILKATMDESIPDAHALGDPIVTPSKEHAEQLVETIGEVSQHMSVLPPQTLKPLPMPPMSALPPLPPLPPLPRSSQLPLRHAQPKVQKCDSEQAQSRSRPWDNIRVPLYRPTLSPKYALNTGASTIAGVGDRSPGLIYSRQPLSPGTRSRIPRVSGRNGQALRSPASSRGPASYYSPAQVLNGPPPAPPPTCALPPLPPKAPKLSAQRQALRT